MTLEEVQLIVSEEFRDRNVEFVLVAAVENDQFAVSVGQTSVMRSVEMLTAALHYALEGMPVADQLGLVGMMLQDIAQRYGEETQEGPETLFEGGFDA